jgi:hypothetical protein
LSISTQPPISFSKPAARPERAFISVVIPTLSKALDGRPCHLLQVPSAFSADEASDDIVGFLEELLPSVLDEEA